MFNFPDVPVSELNKNKKTEFYVFPKGKYYFKIEQAENTKSQAGNPMLALVLSIADDEGHNGKVWDYLVSTENMAWKFHHLCQAIGQEELYTKHKKVNPSMIEGCGGMVEIGISVSKEYGTKNKVVDYVPCESGESGDTGEVPAAAKTDENFNDDIPF